MKKTGRATKRQFRKQLKKRHPHWFVVPQGSSYVPERNVLKKPRKCLFCSKKKTVELKGRLR